MANRLGRRMLSAYAESEPWKQDHEDAILSFELEEMIAYGVSLIRGLMSDDALWEERVRKGIVPYREEDRLQFSEDYRRWADVGRTLLKSAESLDSAGHRIQGLEAFRLALEEVDCILGAEEFETLLPPVEEMLHLANRGNPRPERYGD